MYDESKRIGTLKEARETLDIGERILANTDLNLTDEERKVVNRFVRYMGYLVGDLEVAYNTADDIDTFLGEVADIFASIRNKLLPPA